MPDTNCFCDATQEAQSYQPSRQHSPLRLVHGHLTAGGSNVSDFDLEVAWTITDRRPTIVIEDKSHYFVRRRGVLPLIPGGASGSDEAYPPGNLLVERDLKPCDPPFIAEELHLISPFGLRDTNIILQATNALPAYPLSIPKTL